jgi:hypothetical protein
MAEGSGSPSEDRPAGSPPTEFETFYPKGHVIAMAEDRSQAEAVVQALKDVDFADADLIVLDPAHVVQVADELERRKGLLGRLGTIFGDDDYFADQFVESARNGHPMVAIRAPDQNDAKRAAGILRAHGIHTCSYYGRWTVTDL